MADRVMVMMVDSCKLPRAWGAAPTELQARREAHRQLTAYIAKKNVLGEGLAWEDFIEEVKTIVSKEGKE